MLIQLFTGADSLQHYQLPLSGFSTGPAALAILCKTEGLLNFGMSMEKYMRGVGLGNGTRENNSKYDISRLRG